MIHIEGSGVDKIKYEYIKLSDLQIFSNEQLQKLQEYNISTAEQFVGTCSTPEGFNGIMLALNLKRNRLNEMIYQVKTQLPPDLAKLLSKPVARMPPLGARKPKKIKKKGM